MSVRDTTAFDAFTEEVVSAKPQTRRDVVKEYIDMVGLDYFSTRSKVEHALLNFWERGVRNGV